MSATTAQRKAPWILAILLLSQVMLMSYNAKRPDSEQSILRTWIMTPLSFLERGANSVLSAITGTVASYTDLRGARAENLQLREENDQLRGDLNRALERAAELDLLRAHIALPSTPQYRKLAANVIARDSITWFRRLTIDLGTLDGVRLNMPVATAGGVVGRIISVGPNFSVVQVITDKQAGLGAMLQNSRAMGEVRGFDNARCELRNISTNETVQPGEAVVTTGLDRIYPRGLLIGTVESIDTDPNAPFDRIIVKPAAPVDRLEHVLVLLVEPKDLKLEEEITEKRR
ncbi:MAG TPA: rod shape-determining protein MreC [Blastocatellia bacterium]|nr:rod shape-determining protein MreC [Blastocatellia bacterium]